MPVTDRLESGFLVLADISGFRDDHGARTRRGGDRDATGRRHGGALAAPRDPGAGGRRGVRPGPGRHWGARPVAPRSVRPSLRRLQAATARDGHGYELFLSGVRGVQSLSLKLIVHHGSFIRQVVRGRSRVAGPDIILAHCFLKNDVEPMTYVLFTGAAVERIGIDPVGSGMRRYTGKYAHFDDVDCFVISLDRVGRGVESCESEMLLRLRSLLGDLALRADPGPQDDLRPVVAA